MSADVIARGLASKARSDAAGANAAAASAQGTANAALAGAAARTANTTALISAIRNNGFFPQPLFRAPAANIPAVALSAANVVSPLNGRAYTNPMALLTDARIKVLSGPTVVDGSGAWATRGAWYGTGRSGQYASIEVNHTGSAIELSIVGSFYQATSNLRILVNDRVVALASVPWNTGSYYWVSLTFPSSATRRIRVEGAAGKFRGVNVANTAELTAQTRTYPLITVIGDSFVEGTGATLAQDGEAVTLVRALGGAIALGGVGATGILNPASGGKVAWTDATRMTDLTMAGVTDALGGSTVPAMGIVMMTINDQGMAPAVWSPYGASFQEAVNNRVWALIDGWSAANPGKPLVFFGPTWTNGGPVQDIYRIRDATRDACWGAQGSNVWFIDRLNAKPILRDGAQTDTAGQSYLYTFGGGDTTHPNTAGHNLDALWMAEELRSLILTAFA